MYVIDCRSHPCRVTRGARFHTQDLYGASFECQSLVTGTPNSCSVMHCGPEPISRDIAFERATYWKEHGTRSYLKKYEGYDDAALEEYDELNEVWQFEKPDGDGNASNLSKEDLSGRSETK